LIGGELVYECTEGGWSAGQEPSWDAAQNKKDIRDGELTWRYAGRLEQDVRFHQKLGAVLYVPYYTLAGLRLGCAYNSGINIGILRLSYVNLDAQTKIHQQALLPGQYKLYVFTYLTRLGTGGLSQTGNTWAWGRQPHIIDLKAGRNKVMAYLTQKL
jgi:hypothetical protein